MEVIISAVMIELANRFISFVINKWSKLMALNKEDMVHNLRRLLLRAGAIVDEAEGRCITNLAMLHQLNMMRKELYRGYYMLDTSESRKELMRVLGSLETTLQDAAEFIMLSGGRYPQITRQPYNMYLLLDNCMFGRQKEMEHILNFLLQSVSHTLVEHDCIDERVRRHFSRIVFLTGDDLRGEHMVALQDGGMIKYNNRAFSGKVLIIVELDGDLSDEGLWQMLYSAKISRIACGSKIIITSRPTRLLVSEPQSLRVLYFAEEAFWYFFKVRMFGSIDIMEHPKLRTTPGHILVHDIYQTASTQNGAYRLTASAQSDTAAPMVTLKDLIFGSARPQGNFHALAWRSHIPPHYNCVFKCELKIPQTEVSRKKRT
ncbi:hypothetical protein SETIT_1G130100v2 [Setaria italica]|uniref:Rx N-terminal domain-containing protein n=1 Tax=Setaria italica TaxID=4555 RepID=K3Z0N0_SETIT|nr:hypothetical protein SETIT_1G130100v2 [Setaria italica]